MEANLNSPKVLPCRDLNELCEWHNISRAFSVSSVWAEQTLLASWQGSSTVNCLFSALSLVEPVFDFVNRFSPAVARSFEQLKCVASASLLAACYSEPT